MNSPRAWGSLAALLLSGSLSLLTASGCVEPQSGRTAGGWCRAADSQVVVVDDFEDGDGTKCDKAGRWSVLGPEGLDPAPGPLAHAANLEGDDLTARSPSVRALHLMGTLEPGASAALFVSMPSIPLTPFQEIQFWARATAGDLVVRVNVATAATTSSASGGTCDSGAGACGNHYGDPATIGEAWAAVSTPLDGITPMDPRQTAEKDLEHTLGLEFRVTAPSTAATSLGVGLWIDDVQLKKRP